MKKLLQLLFCLLSIKVNAQQKLIKVNISDNSPEETTIAINPTKINQVVAASNISNYYYSSNGGKTWKEKQLKSQYGVWGDPVLHFDHKGNLYFSHLGKNLNKKFPEWIDKMVVQQIDFNYDTCFQDKAIGMNKNKIQDKEWLGSNQEGKVFLTWTEFDKYKSTSAGDHSRIRFSATYDKGQSWSNPIIVSDKEGDCLDGDGTLEGATSCADAKGTIYVCWGGMMKLWLDKSTDGGKTFGADKIIGTQDGGWEIPVKHIYRANGMPFMHCDNSASAHKGRLYVNWSDVRNGDADVFLKYSDDGGETWSSDIRVNDDQINNGADQFSNNFCIDQSNGNLYVVFYDKRHSSTGAFMDVYQAMSIDGGKTWKNYRLTSTSFQAPGQKEFFGDYIDVDAHKGKVLPIFTLSANKKLSVYTSIFDASKKHNYKDMNALNAVVLNDSLFIHVTSAVKNKFDLQVKYNGRVVKLNRISEAEEMDFAVTARGFSEAEIIFKSGRKKIIRKVNNSGAEIYIR